MISHRSAAALWRIAPVPAGPVELTVRGCTRRRDGMRVHRTSQLDAQDVTVRDWISVTTVSRTLLDLAGRLRPQELADAFREGERRHLVDRSRLLNLCDRMRSRHGTAAMRQLLSSSSLPLSETRSKLEARFLRFCGERGLPVPAVNAPLGEFEVDCLWPRQRVVAEIDSWAHHGDRGAFERDRLRDAAIQRMGHRIVRITDRRLRRPDDLEADLRDLLGLPGGDG